MVSSKERSEKTSKIGDEEGEASSSKPNLDTSVFAEIRSPEKVSDEINRPEEQPKESS